jgi:hypothetical protein
MRDKGARWAIVGLMVLGGWVLTGCGGGGDGHHFTQTLSEDIDTTQFVVPEGEAWQVSRDLTVTADEIEIHGELVARPSRAAGDNGLPIRLKARGNIVINGVIMASDGKNGAAGQAGGKGGNIELVALQGDIRVGPKGRLVSGNGGMGGPDTWGAPGGPGGDIILQAPQGTVSIDRHPGVLQLGNGGNGSDANVSLPPPSRTVQFQNRGGDSGSIQIASAKREGLPASETWLTLEGGYITGGRGGAPGKATLRIVSSRGRTPGADVTVIGAPGSDGINPGNGQSVTAIAGNGTDGDRGGHATAIGGKGGDFTGNGQGTGGNGGSAVAIAGAGGPGIATKKDGGDGGDATAIGGAGGGTPNSNSAASQGGQGGDAKSVAGAGAIGGNGGKGWSGCQSTPPQSGGNGGKGGNATATGGAGGDSPAGTGGNGGAAIAAAGSGGDGGDGYPTAGTGGLAGTATAQGGTGGTGGKANGQSGTASTQPGAKGKDGRVCQTGTGGGEG